MIYNNQLLLVPKFTQDSTSYSTGSSLWILKLSTELVALCADSYCGLQSISTLISPYLQTPPLWTTLTCMTVDVTQVCGHKAISLHPNSSGGNVATSLRQYVICRTQIVNLSSECIMLKMIKCWSLNEKKSLSKYTVDKRRGTRILDMVLGSGCHPKAVTVADEDEFYSQPPAKQQRHKLKTLKLRTLYRRTKSIRCHMKVIDFKVKRKPHLQRRKDCVHSASRRRQTIYTEESTIPKAILILNSSVFSRLFSVLRRQCSLQVLYLSTRNFLFGLPLSIQHQSSTFQCSRQRALNFCPSTQSVRHQVRLQYRERQTLATSNICVTQISEARNINRMVHIDQLPFNCTEITQLLHASDYSKVIQQVLGSVPSTLQPGSLILTHFIAGFAHFKLSQYERARKHFQKSEAIAREVDRDGDVMLCNAYLGDMEYVSQSYTRAATYYKTAIRHYVSGSVAPLFKLTPPTLSAIHAKLASAYRNASMMVQAIDHYRTAIRKAQTDRDRLSAHTSLGNLYQYMGQQ